MKRASKKVLAIDLRRKTFEVGNFTDLHKYVGGMCLGLKLYKIHEEQDPLVLSIGPLNGFFPFASKTSLIINDGGVVEDIYLGGSMSTRICFTGLDSIVFLGEAEEKTIVDITNTTVKFRDAAEPMDSIGLPGRRTTLFATREKAFADLEFTTHEYILESKLAQKNLAGVVITGTEIYKPTQMDKYKELYFSILKRTAEIEVPAQSKPSCSNCPMGCEKSRYGEIGGNIFVHSLVACQYAERIFSDINLTFSCMNTLEYTYTHEDLENIPRLVEETLRLIG